MSLDEHLQCEQFTVNSDWLSAFIWLPKGSKWRCACEVAHVIFSLINDVNQWWWRVPTLNHFCPGCHILLWNGMLILIGVLIQDPSLLPCVSSQSPSTFKTLEYSHSVEHQWPASFHQKHLLDGNLGGQLSWEDSGNLTAISFHHCSNTILLVIMMIGWDMGSSCGPEG